MYLVKIYNMKTDFDNIIKSDTNLLPGWIDELTAERLLDRRSTTLWKLRKQGKIISSKIGSKVYYKLESIMQLLEENAIGSNNF